MHIKAGLSTKLHSEGPMSTWQKGEKALCRPPGAAMTLYGRHQAVGDIKAAFKLGGV